jgi:hypothetical protein
MQGVALPFIATLEDRVILFHSVIQLCSLFTPRLLERLLSRLFGDMVEWARWRNPFLSGEHEQT